MYILSTSGVLREFTSKKLFIPIKGDLAKEGVTIELNDEAYAILSFISSEPKYFNDIEAHLKNIFKMNDNDSKHIKNALDDMIKADMVVRLDNE